MTFAKDLKDGKKKERAAIPLIIEHYKAHHQNAKAWLNPAKIDGGLRGMRRGDIFDSFGIRWEVKYDRRAAETGNVYLEHAALERSEADYVIFFLDNQEPFFVPKDVLLVILNDNKILDNGIRQFPIVLVGQGNEGTLIPLHKLSKLGKEFLKRPPKKARVYKKKSK